MTDEVASNRPSPEPTPPAWLAPQRLSVSDPAALPESRLYRAKRRLLGSPLDSGNLHDERLGKPVALAVLSSDVMSSAAYASESVLRILIPVAGLGAFVLITPITGMLLLVLGLVCLCYRDVVRKYPVAGGSYMVSRENFGFTTAQIPGAALLCSYTLTVAVSIAAGVDAILSAVHIPLSPTELAVIFVVLLTFGNLRGIREAGRVFALPTYWFLVSMAGLIVMAVVRAATGGLDHVAAPAHAISLGHEGGGLLLGASAFLFLRGFANGGSAMTGMEAISNSVTIFREPQVRNARQTLLLMASIIGALFLAVSVLAGLTHAIPTISGTPTVLSQIGREVFGSGAAGNVLYYSLQFSTALILVLGANTSFNGFPNLVSFIARDSYLPRALTTRGQRLVYSNGVLALAAVSILLLVATHADVASLIPLYACTVFTGFTMAGAGMTRYHLTHPGPERRKGLIVNGLAFVASAVVTGIFVVTEFTRGAWTVVLVIPVIVLMLARTHTRYEAEKKALAEEGAPAAVSAPPLRHHAVIVLVDRIDLATARALQLARSLGLHDELRAVHFAVDEERASRLTQGWTKLGLGAIPLEVIECPDRRLVRAAAELANEVAAGGQTQVLLVLPRRAYRGVGGRLLHDHTADRIVAATAQIPNVSATITPFDVQPTLARRRSRSAQGSAEPELVAPDAASALRTGAVVATAPPAIEGTTPLGQVAHRQRVRVSGRVRTVCVQPYAGVSTFECTLVDATGALTVVFLGRRSVAGIEPGARILASGTIGNYQDRLAMLNPTYEFLDASGRHGEAGSPSSQEDAG